MARRYGRKQPEAAPTKTLTAASQILNGPKIIRGRKKATQGIAWQRDAWQLFDEVPEFSFGVELLAQSVSKVRLVAARSVLGVDEPEFIDGEPTEGENGEEIPATAIEIAAAELVAEWAGGPSGQQQIMERIAVHLQVPGESFVVGRVMEDGTQEWGAFSNEEVTSGANGWKINDGLINVTLTGDEILIRVWLPHPMKRQWPRSMTLPLLPVLNEIVALTLSIAASTDSRLAGAGILFVSQGTNIDIPELIETMITPLKDRGTAAAVVPMIQEIPEDAQMPVHVRFEPTNELKEQEKRSEAVVRLARGMPLPQEQILGTGDLNHWTGWLQDEASVKGPVSSLAGAMVNALSDSWFRPALEEMGFPPEEVADYLVWFDTTPLTLRPDRSAQANVGADHLFLSTEAWLRESGFDDADAPMGEDFCRLLLLRLLLTAPAQADVWFDRLGECAGISEMGITEATVVEEAPAGGVQELPASPNGQPQDNRSLPEQNGVASGV